MVFFNICTSIYVPLTDEGTDANETEVLFFVAGPRGQADDGMDVYDIIVHPTVAVKSKAAHAAVYKRKVNIASISRLYTFTSLISRIIILPSCVDL